MIKQHSMLRKTLLSNAIFSFLSGLLMVVLNNWLSSFIGVPYPIILIAIGSGLIIFSLWLFSLALKQDIQIMIIGSVVIMDLIWVVGSVILVIAQLLTSQGNSLCLALASVVFILALLQIIGIRKSKRGEATND
jgi:hypothetical protein